MPNPRKKSKGKRKTKPLEKKEDPQLEKLVMKMSGPISKLPLELIIDILSRLPVKTIKKLSMTVKPLLTLIHHPRFVLVHHTRVIRSTTNSPALIVAEKLGRGMTNEQLYLIDHETVDSLVGTESDSINALLPLKSKAKIQKYKKSGESKDCLSILSSCNGLLCMSPENNLVPDPLYICNPVTGEEMSLPNARIPHKTAYLWTSGFGFDSKTNEYKVVRVLKTVMRGDFSAQVYTLGSDDRWRAVPDLPYYFEGEDFSVFVAGSVHWIGFKSRKEKGTEKSWEMSMPSGLTQLGRETESKKEKIIVSFVVGTEEFGEMPLPSGVGQRTPILHLGVFGGGNLFLATTDSSQRNVQILVQERYGVQASWTKRYVISGDIVDIHFRGVSSTIDKVVGNPNECGFMRMMRNGEILWLHNCGFGYYNPKTRTFRPIGISFKGERQLEGEEKFPVAHVESFISPKNTAILKQG